MRLYKLALGDDIEHVFIFDNSPNVGIASVWSALNEPRMRVLANAIVDSIFVEISSIACCFVSNGDDFVKIKAERSNRNRKLSLEELRRLVFPQDLDENRIPLLITLYGAIGDVPSIELYELDAISFH